MEFGQGFLDQHGRVGRHLLRLTMEFGCVGPAVSSQAFRQGESRNGHLFVGYNAAFDPFLLQDRLKIEDEGLRKDEKEIEMDTKQNYFGYTCLLLIGALSLGAEAYRRAKSLCLRHLNPI